MLNCKLLLSIKLLII